MKLILHVILSVAAVLSVPGQVVVQPPSIRVHAGDGIVIITNGFNRLISAPAGSTNVMLKAEYDPAENGQVDHADDADALGGVPASSYASTNDVAEAISGVHAPVTLAPWSIGALFGQRLGISSTNVMDAVAGKFVDRSTGGVVTGIEARIEMTGGSSYIEAESGSFRTGLSVNANPVLTIGSELDATKLAGVLPALNGGSLTNLTAAAIVGTLPAISGANLTGVLHSIASGSIGSTEIANGSIAAADTAITGTPSGTKTLRDDWSWQEPAAPQWSVGWGPGEIIGPFYDGSNDAAGWSRTALDSGSYKVAGMGFSSSLTSLQDVTFYVTVFSPPNSTVLDTSKAIELTFWTTTASAADQKFDLYVYGSTVAMASPVLEYSSTGIVGASPNVPQVLTIAKASLANPNAIYRAYTFKVVSYSKSTGKVNFVRGCVNGR